MLQPFDPGDPFTHPEIIHTLQDVNTHLTREFGRLTPEQFYYHTPGVWSAAENLQHLILSVDATSRGLNFPKMVLQVRFGKADQPSHRYAEVCDTYHTALAAGIEMKSQFVPQTDNFPSNPAEEQTRLVDAWMTSGAALVDVTYNWNETQLDSLRLPHPLLGLMTARELLIWTICHNVHHLDDVRRLLGSGL
jgi:hypothetical protein